MKSDEFLKRARSIRLLVLDVDGVLSDGSIVVDRCGNEMKRFHVRDGFALRAWRRAGHRAAILSGRFSQAVAFRGRELGIDPIAQGINDKGREFERILVETGFAREQACCMGDDLPDLPLLSSSGIGATVADAAPEVRERADWISSAAGGRGAVRELIEQLLRAQDRWAELVASHIPSASL